MSLIERELKSVWDGLRGSRPHRDNFLEEINIRNMRGIKDLRVPFDYPVTVLAGENACGKSTVLFGCAAAYKVPDTNPRVNAPSALFPVFSESGADNMAGIELEYAYINRRQRMSMKWRKGKSWNRSFLGRKGASQPERNVYLRTLANLSNPSEVRGMLQIRRRQLTISQVPAELLLLASRVLSFKYQDVSKVQKKGSTNDLLLAELEEEKGHYSEFHMASGERSILRLSMEISTLHDALVLIDEVETGLHPYIQQLLMLNLQQMALREQLQIIVTTHSPVILNCVPLEARIFLSRNRQNHDVQVEPPMRDILQKAMYGQSIDKLSIICEDKIAEAMIRGVVEALSASMNFGTDQIEIGRNTGRDEFAHHVRTLAKVGGLPDCLFVMDGDSRAWREKVAGAVGGERAAVLFLPGDTEPEEWLWQIIKQNYQAYEELLAIPHLQEEVRKIEQSLSGTVHELYSSHLFKRYFMELSDKFQQDQADIARKIARHCAEEKNSAIINFAIDLQDIIDKWRRAR